MRMTDKRVLIIIGIVVAIVFALGLYAAALGEKRWQQFVKTHNCKIIAKTEGRTAWGVGSDGKSVSYYIPDTTTYQCNDGVTYTR